MADGGIVESVENLVVSALKQQVKSEYHACEPPDSEEVTRDIINAVADVMEGIKEFPVEGPGYYISHFDHEIAWLRSQAKGGTDD